MHKIAIYDIESIKQLKELEKYERNLIKNIINRDNNSADELLSCLSTVNLIHISYEYHAKNSSTIGYKIAVNAAQTLGKLYEVLLSIRHSLIKESDKLETIHRLEDINTELKKVTLIVDDTMQEISKLLTCDGFIHAIDITYDNETLEVLFKKLILKRHSSSIPNPHQIPSVYQIITSKDNKKIYRLYSNY
jgi:hypothetical protein